MIKNSVHFLSSPNDAYFKRIQDLKRVIILKLFVREYNRGHLNKSAEIIYLLSMGKETNETENGGVGRLEMNGKRMN